MTFSDRIENLVGAYPYGTNLEQILQEAARLVIAELPEGMLMSFAVEETDDGTNGVDVTNKRIVKAHKAGYKARLIDETLDERLTNVKEPTPVYYVSQNTAYVKPAGGKVVTVSFPTIRRNMQTVTGWPTMLVDLVVERAAVMIYDLMMVDVREGYGTSVTLPTAPTAPAAPSFTGTDATAVAPSATTIASLPTAPVYTAPVLDAKPTTPTVGTLDLATKVDGVTALTPPTAPATPSISFSDATEATVGSVTVAALPDVPTYGTVNFGGDLDLPNFPSIDLTTEIDALTSLDPPTLPSAANIAAIDAAAVAVGATTIGTLLDPAPTYGKPEYGGAIADVISAVPSLIDLSTKLDDITALTVPAAPEGPNLSSAGQSTSVVDFTISDNIAPSYSAEINTLAAAIALWTPYYTSEDPEMMGEALNRVQIELADLQRIMQDKRNKTDVDTEVYRAEVQRAITDAQLAAQEYANELSATDQMTLQTYIQTLNRFEKQVISYQQELSVQTQQFEINLQRAITGLLAAERLYLEQYSLDIQNEVNEFQKEVVIYQQDAQHKIEQARVTLQEAIANAQNSTEVAVRNEAQTLQALVRDWEADIELFQIGMTRYEAEVARQVQTFQLNYEKAFTPYREQQALYLQQYQLDISKNSDAYRGLIEDHSAEVQRIIEQSRVDASLLQQQAQLTTDVAIQNEVQTASIALENYAQSANRFALETNLYRAEAELVIAEFSNQIAQDLQLFQLDANIGITRYGVLLENARQVFEKELSVYQATLQRNVAQAQIAAQEASQTATEATNVALQNKARQLEKEVQEYQSTVAKYQSDVGLYNAQVQSALSNQGVVTESTIAKIRMFSEDRNRAYQRFDQRYKAFLRAFHPRRSYVIQQHAI